MALHLITGYAGQEHITSADQGAYNMATYGSGNFVLDRGRKFAHTVMTNNRITLADGEAMVQGRFIKMASGTSEDVTIENGSQGKLRNDLICIRYEKSSTNATESAKFIVHTGVETTGTPVDPSYVNGNITDGTDTVTDFPLYRVRLNGINIETVTALFSVKVSMVNYMDNYQMPKASKSDFGAVKIGGNLSVNNGVVDYSLPAASSSQLGGVKIGSNLSINNGVVSVPAATSSALGVVKNGTGINNTSGTLSLATATSSSLGGVRGNGNVKVDSNGDMNYTLPTATITTKGAVRTGAGIKNTDGYIEINYKTKDPTLTYASAPTVPANGILPTYLPDVPTNSNKAVYPVYAEILNVRNESGESVNHKLVKVVTRIDYDYDYKDEQWVFKLGATFFNPGDTAINIKSLDVRVRYIEY